MDIGKSFVNILCTKNTLILGTYFLQIPRIFKDRSIEADRIVKI